MKKICAYTTAYANVRNSSIECCLNNIGFYIIQKIREEDFREDKNIMNLEESDETIGFNDYFNSDAVTIIEWADMIEDKLPEERLEIKFKVIDENTRVLVLTPYGQAYEDVVNSVL